MNSPGGAAGPDSDFIGWYEPAIGDRGKEPDFVLFGNQYRLLILEVKDWQIDQIEEGAGPIQNSAKGGRARPDPIVCT